MKLGKYDLSYSSPVIFNLLAIIFLHEHWSFSTNDNILVFGTEFLKFSIESYASMKRLRITMHNAIEYRVEEWRFQ